MATSPIPTTRLEQIANDVCKSTLSSTEYYEHAKTPQWNAEIIEKILKAVMAEATSDGGTAPTYKFAINSTIVQHVVPTSQLNKSTGTSTGPDVNAKAEESKVADKKGQAGRRGMHSATGGYWNEKTDGMWSYKFDAHQRTPLKPERSILRPSDTGDVMNL